MNIRLGRAVIVAGVIGIALIVLLMLVPGIPIFGFLLHSVAPDEVGVKISNNQFVEVLPPGTYSAPFDWYTDIINVRQSALRLEVEKADVLTRQGLDQQVIGIRVAFDTFRPGAALTAELWRQYQADYRHDDILIRRIQQMVNDALTTCGNQTTFQQAAGGEGRTILGGCIQSALSQKAEPLQITIANVSVTNISISQQAIDRLEQIRDLNQQVDAAQAQAELAEANSGANEARIRGEAREQVAPTQVYLEARATEGALQLTAIAINQQQAEAQATNDAFRANADLALEQVRLEIARIKALADNAEEAELARVINENPAYAAYLIAEAQAQAVQGVEKIIVPAGTNPLLIMGGTAIPNIMIEPPVTATPAA